MEKNEKDSRDSYQLIYYGAIGLVTLAIASYFYLRGRNPKGKKEDLDKKDSNKDIDINKPEAKKRYRKKKKNSFKEDSKKEPEIIEKEKEKLIEKEIDKEKKEEEKNIKPIIEESLEKPLNNTKKINLSPKKE